jgi:uncharacterized radical SAM superfamily Fe-S cluster-containing enzyme
MPARVRPYLFYDAAISICSTCYRKVDAKILIEDDRVYMLKRCPRHGFERVLVADDAAYYRLSRERFIKPPEMPRVFNTPIRHGCPYDCGLCPDHEQHSCVSLLEITDRCNLACPVCYAASGPHRPEVRSLEVIERMLDLIVRNEGEPDVLQISGGEPTTHPEFFRVIEMARERPIRHIMLNTNGVRIASDEAFADRLAEQRDGFEVYLQFDSLEAGPLVRLRGADLRDTRLKALERLNRLGISTTLVVTLWKGVNTAEIGRIIDFALAQPCVRGVTFQPIQHAGRADGFDPATDRLTLSEVRREILRQCPLFKPEDVIPVPCNPDSLAMAYALKLPGSVVPLTGMVDPDILIQAGRNTIRYEPDVDLQGRVFRLFSTNHSPESSSRSLHDLLCCLPRVSVPEPLGYENVFRIIIMQFIDAHAFDIRAVKKSCVHIATPDGRLVPFDTFNLFYRDNLEQQRLVPLRRSQDAAALNQVFISTPVRETTRVGDPGC